MRPFRAGDVSSRSPAEAATPTASCSHALHSAAIGTELVSFSSSTGTTQGSGRTRPQISRHRAYATPSTELRARSQLERLPNACCGGVSKIAAKFLRRRGIMACHVAWQMPQPRGAAGQRQRSPQRRAGRLAGRPSSPNSHCCRWYHAARGSALRTADHRRVSRPSGFVSSALRRCSYRLTWCLRDARSQAGRISRSRDRYRCPSRNSTRGTEHTRYQSNTRGKKPRDEQFVRSTSFGCAYKQNEMIESNSLFPVPAF